MVPVLGALVTGQWRADAYNYLPRSVLSWYNEETLRNLLQEAGFTDVETRKVFLGVVIMLTGVKQ